MRLIIVDDEKIIRNGIASLIRKCAPNWEIVCEADSASEVLNFARDNAAELILLDIKMPQLTGIDLMRELKSLMPNIMFVVVSGYSDFNYAQQAIRLGAFDYLTKPINAGKLLNLLNRAEAKIQNQHSLQNALDTLHKETPERKLSFLRNVVFGIVKYNPAEIDAAIKNYGLSEVTYQFSSIIHKDNFSETHFDKDFQKCLKHMPVSGFCLNHSNIFSSFLLICPSDSHYDIQEIYSYMASIYNGLKKEQILISAPVSDLLDLNKYYYQHLLPLKSSIAFSESQEDFQADIVPSLDHGAYAPLVEETIKNIQQHYFENITLTTLAKMVSIHPIYLSELFKKETNMNISNYITAYRIERAKEMLQDIENKIYDVANLVGYDDSRYFSQVFKKHTGMTPTQYRESLYIHPKIPSKYTQVTL